MEVVILETEVCTHQDIPFCCKKIFQESEIMVFKIY